jgi:hypothetical protein
MSHVQTMAGAVKVQTCNECRHTWDGRPLHGLIETRAEPWPALRLRLTDDLRSSTITFSEQQVQRAGEHLADRLRRGWLRLERQLCGGYADADQPTSAQLARAARARARAWDVPDGENR